MRSVLTATYYPKTKLINDFRKKPNHPKQIRIWNFSCSADHLPKVISPFYDLGNSQSWRHWKYIQLYFHTCKEITLFLHELEVMVVSKWPKLTYEIWKFSRFPYLFPNLILLFFLSLTLVYLEYEMLHKESQKGLSKTTEVTVQFDS